MTDFDIYDHIISKDYKKRTALVRLSFDELSTINDKVIQTNLIEEIRQLLSEGGNNGQKS